MRIAVLGTGIMGAPIARRLAEAGHEVRVWNRTREKAEGLGADGRRDAGRGGRRTPSSSITMLADGPTVDAVVREAVASAVPGTLWVQTSTVGVDWTTRLAALAADSGLAYVDAPVLGTRAPAEQGQLVVVLAGPEGARAICEEVLPAIARKLVWLGDEIGSASALKLVLNHWILNSLENVAETIAFAQALGVEPERFLESIAGGGMDMPYAHMKTEAIVSGNMEPSFTLRLAAKDVELIVDAASNAGIDLALAPAALERMTRAIELGHGDEDMAATYYATRRE